MIVIPRRFHLLQQREFLERLGAIRRAIIEAWQVVPFGTPLHKIERELMRHTDDAVEMMTGNREHFWSEPHSTPPDGGHQPKPFRDPIDADAVARSLGRKAK